MRIADSGADADIRCRIRSRIPHPTSDLRIRFHPRRRDPGTPAARLIPSRPAGSWALQMTTALTALPPPLRWLHATPFYQAGLQGYSDAAMRILARRHGAPYCVTESLLDEV